MFLSVMTTKEWRATSGLAAIYAVRMAGLFMILPVLVLYTDVLEGATPVLVGFALGVYGLTQAILQIPFGMLSDRFGRKPLIAAGLILFISGSLLAAIGETMLSIILGRALQGAGAVAAVVLALTGDLIAEERRTRALAIIGLTIGLTFTAALVLGPLIDRYWGLSGIFWVSAGLGCIGLILLFAWIPSPERSGAHPDVMPIPATLRRMAMDRRLLRLNAGIFLLHLILAANFLVIPLLLLDSMGLPAERHYLVYLPILLLGFLLMIPFIILAERRRLLKPSLLVAIGILLAAEVLLSLSTSTWMLVLALMLFFAVFNYLEATLPSLVVKVAPVDAKGSAMGLFTTSQFLGIFIGGTLGGWMFFWFGAAGVFGLGAMAAALWWWLAITMERPQHLSFRAYAIPVRWQGSERQLEKVLIACPGIAEVRVGAPEEGIFLKVASEQLDESQLRQILTGETGSFPQNP